MGAWMGGRWSISRSTTRVLLVCDSFIDTRDCHRIRTVVCCQWIAYGSNALFCYLCRDGGVSHPDFAVGSGSFSAYCGIPL